MSRDISKQIKKREQRRQTLLNKLLESQEMVRGTFCRIYVKCGKESCTCRNGEGHPHDRMSWRHRGKKFSRAVPKEDHSWISQMTDRFRTFRQIRREIRKLDAEIKQLLDEYEEAIADATVKGRPYLEVWKA